MRDRVVRRGEGLREKGAQAMAQATNGQDQAGEAEARAAGRARVREHLIAPLAGLARHRGQSVEAHDKEMAKLAERLAYMRETALKGLAELVLRQAGVGKAARPTWPEIGVIIAWGYALQVPPPRDSDYVRSLMRSAMGARARDEGWMVELFRAARRFGPPPGAYVIGKLKDEARENVGILDRIRERSAAGMQTADDIRWLAAWHDDLREAEALVTDGDARRAALAQAGAAA
jgi:hypothetical protein